MTVKNTVTNEELYEQADAVRKHAYCPYSGYPVGAALLARDDAGNERVFTGVNIENASFGATICAERTAAVKAVSEGFRHFVTIAVTAEGEEASPCGICRQFLSEFGPDMDVVTGVSVRALHVKPLRELLAGMFTLKRKGERE